MKQKTPPNEILRENYGAVDEHKQANDQSGKAAKRTQKQAGQELRDPQTEGDKLE